MRRKTRPRAQESRPLAPSAGEAALASAACGALLGAAFAAAQAARTAPALWRNPWPAAAWPRLESFLRLADLALWLWGAPLAGAALFALLVAWTLAARSLNPRVPPFPFAGARPPGLAWAVVGLSGAALVGGAALWDALCGLAGLAVRSADPVVDFLHVLPLSAAGGALAWLLVSPAGWAGDLEEWRDPLAAAPRSWPRIAGLGAAYGAALALGARACGALIALCGALDAEVWHPGPVPRDAATTVLACAALGALVLPAAWSLAWALAPDRASPRQRLKRASPGLWTAGVAAAAGLALYAHAAYAYGWAAGGLAPAAALPDQDAPVLTVVTLQPAAGRRVSASSWEASARYYDAAAGSWGRVPATPANVSALARFLVGRDAPNRYRGAAVAALANSFAALWQPEAAYSALDRLDLPGGIPAHLGALERIWLARAAPITPENRARLAALSDPQAYRVPGHFEFLLSKAWLRFGDLERARRWLDAARADEAGAAELSGYEVPPRRTPLALGVVSGRVVARGLGRAPIVVALVALGDGETEAAPPADAAAVLKSAAASQRVRGDGSFEFRRLGAGRYALHVLLAAPVADPDAVAASKSPGVVVLSRERPRYEAGTIVVSLARAEGR